MAILLRTALFVPGNRPDRIEKALATDADAIIIDLEDSVPLSEKRASRSRVREKLAAYANRFILIRINPLGSPFIEGDLVETIEKSVSGIVLPKVERPDDILEINRLLLEVEKTKALAEGFLRVFPLIESAAGVQHIYEILTATTKPQRICTVAFGAADYTLDLGIEMTKEGTETLYARSRIPIACKASGIASPLDTPFMIDLDDLEALSSDARLAKMLGFQGKLVIHPKQIEPCNRIFSPSPQEIAWCEKVLQSFERAEASGTAAIQLEGKFIDYALVKRCRETLELASAIRNKERS